MATRNGKNANSPFWHNRQIPASLGCLACADRSLCGGISIEHPAYDCMEFCKCADPSLCNYVCPRNVRHFVARIREVNGLKLDNVEAAPLTAISRLPTVVPMIYGRARRSCALRTECVGLSLLRLFSTKNGRPLVANAAALADRFRYAPDAKLILVGVGPDSELENYWSRARSADCLNFIASLKPALVTTPNFSVFSDVTRWDNFQNMKRIAICWSELARRGVPTALHLNARTEKDYERWRDFLRDHPEITALAFEFKTGPGSPKRGAWHAMRLAEVAEKVPRPLTLVVRGGRRHLQALSNFYSAIAYLATDPYMRTIRRRQLDWTPGKRIRWTRVSNISLDTLLQHNVGEFTRMISYKVENAKPITS
jgi:hypothetical protein